MVHRCETHKMYLRFVCDFIIQFLLRVFMLFFITYDLKIFILLKTNKNQIQIIFQPSVSKVDKILKYEFFVLFSCHLKTHFSLQKWYCSGSGSDLFLNFSYRDRSKGTRAVNLKFNFTIFYFCFNQSVKNKYVIEIKIASYDQIKQM